MSEHLPHDRPLPYPESLETRLARAEEQIGGLRREIGISESARDAALKELKDTTREWKAQANEWRTTVGDVGAAKQESRDYSDAQNAALREYVEEKFTTAHEARRQAQRTVYLAIGAATGLVVAAVVVMAAILGTN